LPLGSVREVNEADARKRAMSELNSRFPEFRDGEWIVASVQEFQEAWAFTYNSRAYVETRDIRYSLGGNGALVVPKSGERPWLTWAGADTATQVEQGHSASWSVAIVEHSAGAYRCTVTDEQGRSTSASGDDPDDLRARCISDLREPLSDRRMPSHPRIQAIESTTEPLDYLVRFDIGPDRIFTLREADGGPSVASIVPPPPSDWHGDAESVRVAVGAVVAFHRARTYDATS